jgi:hypothetical protein
LQGISLKVATSSSHLDSDQALAAKACNLRPSAQSSQQTLAAIAVTSSRITIGSGLRCAHSPLTASADLYDSPALVSALSEALKVYWLKI